MNNCILMASVIQAPQLRYTSDTQTPVAEMVVQFDPLREGDPPASLKVIGWNNLAQDMQAKYQAGDRIILEGRLGINVFDSPHGFKEKKAELTAQRIHLLGGGEQIVGTSESDLTAVRNPSAPAPMPPMTTPMTAAPMPPVTAATAPVTTPMTAPVASTPIPQVSPTVSPTPPAPTMPSTPTEADYDEIPF
ncbi:MAG: single-stranded DNA-binding protein [Merismopedia sp. SIO2A8]|nr:single-stranded DNA-binding protein [Merismopedia sp. SIO2A8]